MLVLVFAAVVVAFVTLVFAVGRADYQELEQLLGSDPAKGKRGPRAA